MGNGSKYSYLAKNTILFTVSSFSSKLIVFLLVPLYTNVLSTSEYGVADLITTTSTLLIYIFTLNITDSVLRFAIEDKKNQIRFLSYGISVLLVGSILFLIALIVAWKLKIFPWNEYCYVFLFFHYFFTACYQIVNNYLRAINKVKEVAISGIVSTFVVVGLNLLFLVVFKLGILGYLISMVAGVAAALIYCFAVAEVSLPQLIKQKCGKSEKREMLRYSIPLIFNGVAWWINNSIDKYFVAAICGAGQNGIYSVSYKIPTILTVFHSIFSQAWNLSAIKEFDSDDKDGFFAKTYTMYNAMLVILCSTLILANVFIAKFMFAKDFFIAWESSSVLLISVVFSALSGFLGSIFTAVKDSKIFAVSTVISAVINCILNYLLIPQYGIKGAAIATAISFGAIWLIRLICTRKYIKWTINLKRDAIAYILIIVQTVLEHSDNHVYVGQVVILIVIIVLYRECIVSIFKKLCNKLLSKSKH